MKRPMLFAAVMSSGAVVALYYFRNYSLLLCIGLIILLTILIYANKRLPVLLAVAVVIAVCISVLVHLDTLDTVESFSGKSLTVKLVAVGNPENRGDYRIIETYVLNGGVIPRYSKLSLVDFGFDFPISGGTVFEAFIKIESLKNSDYTLYNLSEGCYAQAKLLSLYPCEETSLFLSSIQNIRDYVSNTLFSSLSSDTASTLLAVVTGDKTYLSAAFADDIKISGVSHVMAVSGLHLTIIMNGAFSVINKIFNNRFLKCFVTIFVVIAVASVCGFTMSIIRAGIMCIISAFAPIFKRDRDSLNSLAVTVVLVLFFSPFAVFSVAFQLSTLATFGIVCIAPFFNRLIEEKCKLPFLVMKPVSCIVNTLGATIMTLPVSIYNFRTVSFVSPITNILITYPVTIMLLFTTGALIVNLVTQSSIILKPMFFVCGVAAKYTNYVVSHLARLPFAAMRVMSKASVFNAVLVSVFFVAAVLLGIWIYNRIRLKKIYSAF